MGMSQGRLRPADLAREHGLSTQAVRNYEEDGILPPAPRSPHGYRQYTRVHAQALRTFLALRPGHGHTTAGAIMRSANAADREAVFRLVDESHARSLRDRVTLDEVGRALGEITAAPALLPAGERPMSIGALARRLDVHPATLRTWERAGILSPERDPVSGYRRYGAESVRDAHLAQQLRRGGHPLSRIAPVVDQLRSAGGAAPLEETLRGWRAGLSRRSRSMLTGAVQLARYLDLVDPEEPDGA
ncbi:MerR family transcriptional regulator [Streptomyces sp. NPDC020141]|uniref:MerR family transcriptional regulator n=1 Tax=Streptomyces sp. NPDC020141 TaxID=3365065 RepID=UPI0037A3AE3E